MMFWVLAAFLVALSGYPLFRALSAEPEARDPVGDDVAFFKAQDAEIDRQVGAGAMSADEARAAKAEAARKLLVKARAVQAGADTSGGRTRFVRYAVLAAIPLLTVPIYLQIGAPALPDMPIATRTDIDRSAQDLARLIARLDAHLAENPDDVRGLELAFPAYMRLARYDSAVDTAARLVALKGETAERLVTLAEALIYRAKGEVDADAKKALGRALELDPKLPPARFYSALAAEQAGDVAGALVILRAMEKDVGDGPEKQAVAAQIARITKTSPPASTADAIRAMPDADRTQAIRGMVDGLAARLKADGGSVDEWQRLVRALSVLGEKDRALAALKDARSAMAADATGLAALGSLARELGLEQGAAQ